MILTQTQAQAVLNALRALDPVDATLHITLHGPRRVDLFIGAAAIDLRTVAFPPDRESHDSRAAFGLAYGLV